MSAEKYCRACDRVLPITDFNRDATRSDGYQSRCRSCNSAAAKARYADDAAYREAVAKRSQDSRERRQSNLAAPKTRPPFSAHNGAMRIKPALKPAVAAPGPAPDRPDDAALEVGRAVKHALFGVGTISEKDDDRVVVVFGDQSHRTFDVRYARLAAI